MKEASPIQRVNSEMRGIYKSWFDTLDLLSQITDPSARSMFVDELKDLSLRVEKLLGTGALQANQESQAKILLSRPPEQWALLAKERPIVPTF